LDVHGDPFVIALEFGLGCLEIVLMMINVFEPKKSAAIQEPSGRLHAFGIKRVIHPLAALFGSDQPGTREAFHVMADRGLRKPGQFLEIAGADAIAAATDLTAGEVHQDFQARWIGERLEDPGERLEHGITVLSRVEVWLELDQCCAHAWRLLDTLTFVNMLSLSMESRKSHLRLLILCTANSARSQMAEGWARAIAQSHTLELEIHSAGTKASRVNPNAIAVMGEVGIDLGHHSSKTLYDVPDPWNFDVVLTVCDSANEACPVYPVKSVRLHHSFPDPAGQPDEPKAFREVRDQIKPVIERLILEMKAGRTPTEAALLEPGSNR
jgi:arsenate reductase (thioredoxin)